MPESVLSPYGRDLLWDVNVPGEKANWSYLEKENLYELCRAHGMKGAIRFEDYRNHGNFAQMLTDLGNDGELHTVLIPDEVFIITDTTIPSNLTLVRVRNGRFYITDNTTLTFAAGSKLITENNKLVFNLQGGSSWMSHVDLGGAVDYITPEMFGGGADGLADILEGVTTPRRLDIINDLTITGYIDFATAGIDLASVAPDAHIIVGAGAELVVGKMSATPTHDIFSGSKGTITMANNPTGEAWDTPCQRVAGFHMLALESPPSGSDSGVSSTTFAKVYFHKNGEVIQIRVAYNGLTYYIPLSTV